MACMQLTSRGAAPAALSRASARRAPRAAALPQTRASAAVPTPSRRALLTAGTASVALVLGATPAAPALAVAVGELIPIAELPKPFRAAQRSAFQKALLDELNVSALPLDQRALMRLFFNDAAAGRRDGSVHFSEELSRPENAGLADTVKALAQIKARFDQASKTEDGLSWTDLIAFATRVNTRATFREAVKKQLGPNTELLPPGLGNDFPIPPLGGVDGTAPAPAGSIPGPNAPVTEWRACFERLKLRAPEVAAIGPDVCGPDAAAAYAMLAQDAEYAENLARMDAIKAQLGRTSYEVTYARAFGKLALVGFKTDEYQYLYPEPRPQVRL